MTLNKHLKGKVEREDMKDTMVEIRENLLKNKQRKGGITKTKKKNRNENRRNRKWGQAWKNED